MTMWSVARFLKRMPNTPRRRRCSGCRPAIRLPRYRPHARQACSAASSWSRSVSALAARSIWRIARRCQSVRDETGRRLDPRAWRRRCIELGIEGAGDDDADAVPFRLARVRLVRGEDESQGGLPREDARRARAMSSLPDRVARLSRRAMPNDLDHDPTTMHSDHNEEELGAPAAGPGNRPCPRWTISLIDRAPTIDDNTVPRRRVEQEPDRRRTSSKLLPTLPP